MGQIFDIQANLTRLIETPYERPNVENAQTFLRNFANDVQQNRETRRYFTENPNGIDEISRYLKTDKELKSRLAENRTLIIRINDTDFEATILDLIRLHRSYYGPFEKSHKYIHALLTGRYISYQHSLQSIKNENLESSLRSRGDAGLLVNTLQRSPLDSTPFADLYDLFEAQNPEIRVQCLISLAQKGHSFALAALVEIYTVGLQEAMIHTVVEANLEHAARLAEQLTQFEHSPVALYQRACFTFKKYEVTHQQGDHEKASKLKTEYKRLVIGAAELGHIGARCLLALEKLVGHEISPDRSPENRSAIFAEVRGLQSLPEYDSLKDILEVFCQQNPTSTPYISDVLGALWSKANETCAEILTSVILNQDHYRSNIGMRAPDLSGKNARELVRHLSSIPSTHLQYNPNANDLDFPILNIIKNPYVSEQRKRELIVREIESDISNGLDHIFRALSFVSIQTPKLTHAVMRSLLQMGYFDKYLELVRLFNLDMPNVIPNRATACIGMDHYQYLFNNTLVSRAISAGKHEADYTKTMAGRIAYVEIYEKLKFLRDKLIESIPTVMTGPLDDQEEKEDIQRFFRIIDEQAEKALIYPEMNKLEAKQKAKEAFLALQQNKK